MQDLTTEDFLRVLVVDDDELDRVAAHRALEKSGLRVIVDDAYTMTDALDALEHRHYDCALLDFTLPDGDGLLLLHEAQSRGIVTPIIMLTGVTDELIAVELMKAGAADYLPKSKVSPESLMRAVQSARRLHLANRSPRIRPGAPCQ